MAFIRSLKTLFKLCFVTFNLKISSPRLIPGFPSIRFKARKCAGPKNFLDKIEYWVKKTEPQKLIYHPYISEAGERGPFINSNAQASLLGLNSNDRFHEIVRCFIEGLCFAAKECYLAIGEIPKEIRLAGGGSQSDSIRKIFSNISFLNLS